MLYSMCTDHVYIQCAGTISSAITIHRSLFTYSPQSPLILACRKYFMPIQATTTHTQAMTQVRMSRAG